MLVVCQGGELGLLSALRTYLRTLTLRLYVNGHTPTEDDTSAEYAEASYPNYAALPLRSWATVRLNEAGHAVCIHDLCTFAPPNVSPTVMVFGVFVTDSQDRLIWAEERTAGPFSLQPGGSPFTYLPKFQIRPDAPQG